jgi:hypothetical protein
VSDQREPVPFLDAVWFAQARQRHAFAATMHGRSATASEPMTDIVPSFDGGARQSPPLPPPSHEETLVEIIRASRPGA